MTNCQSHGLSPQRLSKYYFLWTCLLVFLPYFCKAAYIIRVESLDEECYFINAGSKSSMMLYGNFEQLSDDLSADPLSVVISDRDSNRILHRSRRSSREGSFNVKLSASQRAQICIENGVHATGGGSTVSRTSRHVDREDRLVGLHFNVEPHSDDLEVRNQYSKNIESVENLQRQISSLKNHHEYMRMREAMHREVTEQTFSQMMVWAVLRGFMVIAVATGQIIYLRRFVEVRRYI